jgi:hypothetical protein
VAFRKTTYGDGVVADFGAERSDADMFCAIVENFFVDFIGQKKVRYSLV